MLVKIMNKHRNMPQMVKASLWYVVCSVLQKGIAFLTTPIFTRLMTTEQYGQVTIYNSWLEIFMIFATLNLFYGVYNNALTKYPDDRDVVTSSLQGLCTTITCVLFLVYCIANTWINRITGMSTLMTCILFAEVLFVPAFRFFLAKQRYEYKYKSIIIASLFVTVMTPLLGIPAVLLSSEKGFARIFSGVIAQIAVAVVLYIIIFKRGKVFYNKNCWKYALEFNLPLIPHYLSSVVLNQCDRLMIDSMCGTDKAGIYGLAYTIGSLAIIFSEAIMNSYTPWTYQNLKLGNFSKIKENTKYIVIVVAVLSLGLVFIAPEVIWILGGEKYKEGVWIIAPIAGSIFFRFLYSLYGNIEFYYEENRFIAVASMLCAVLNMILNYIFIASYGYLAAGFTTLVCFMVYAYAHFVFSKKVLKKYVQMGNLYDNKFTFIISVLVSLLCIVMMSLYEHAFIRYILVALLILLGCIFKNKIRTIIMIVRGKE